MAIFYFDVQCRGEYHRDNFGDAFGTVAEAVAHVQALLPDLARDYTLDERNIIACELRDERGEIVYRAELTFRSTNIVC